MNALFGVARHRLVGCEPFLRSLCGVDALSGVSGHRLVALPLGAAHAALAEQQLRSQAGAEPALPVGGRHLQRAVGAKRRPEQAATQWTVTVPAVPSTVTWAPSGIRRVPPVTETTQGIPSSRDTITAWLSCAPT